MWPCLTTYIYLVTRNCHNFFGKIMDCISCCYLHCLKWNYSSLICWKPNLDRPIFRIQYIVGRDEKRAFPCLREIEQTRLGQELIVVSFIRADNSFTVIIHIEFYINNTCIINSINKTMIYFKNILKF